MGGQASWSDWLETLRAGIKVLLYLRLTECSTRETIESARDSLEPLYPVGLLHKVREVLDARGSRARRIARGQPAMEDQGRRFCGPCRSGIPARLPGGGHAINRHVPCGPSRRAMRRGRRAHSRFIGGETIRTPLTPFLKKLRNISSRPAGMSRSWTPITRHRRCDPGGGGQHVGTIAGMRSAPKRCATGQIRTSPRPARATPWYAADRGADNTPVRTGDRSGDRGIHAHLRGSSWPSREATTRQVVICRRAASPSPSSFPLHGISLPGRCGRLTRAATAFAAGETGLPCRRPRKDEIGELTAASTS